MSFIGNGARFWAVLAPGRSRLLLESHLSSEVEQVLALAATLGLPKGQVHDLPLAPGAVELDGLADELVVQDDVGPHEVYPTPIRAYDSERMTSSPRQRSPVKVVVWWCAGGSQLEGGRP